MEKQVTSGMNFVVSNHCKYMAIVRNNNKKLVVVVGQTQVSPKEFNTVKEAEEMIKNPTTEFLVETMFTINYLTLQEHENKNKKQDQKVVEKDA